MLFIVECHNFLNMNTEIKNRLQVYRKRNNVDFPETNFAYKGSGCYFHNSDELRNFVDSDDAKFGSIF